MENRVHREIAREKPRTAPRHTVSSPASAGGSDAEDTADSIHGKNDPLLNLLKSVYVDSRDPAAEVRFHFLRLRLIN
ncbi:hypothetical protein LDENG_00245560 [Lucifuga dentata]|nr:hypothetical protein LDENG_00245560 [Lucifuga dentata]